MTSSADAMDDRRWAALAVLCTAAIFVNLDLTVVNVAVPAIARGLHASAADVLWVVAAYGLAFACVLPAAGALADRFGHRKAFLVGVAGFGASSLVAALSPTPEVLTVARLACGVGAAVVYPATLALIGDIFPAVRERQWAISVWVGLSSIGLLLGPVFGGSLIDWLGWHTSFLIAPPLCLAVLVSGWILIPTDAHRLDAPVDVVGVLLLAFGLAAVLLALIEGQQKGWLSPVVPTAVASGAALLGVFVVWELRTRYPMVEFALFRSRTFAAGTLALAIPYFALPAWALFLSQYLQSVLGASAFSAGLVLAPTAAGQLTGALVAPWLMRRVGANGVAVLGVVLSGLAIGVFLAHGLSSTLAHVCVNRFVDGVGTGLLVIPATDAIMRGLEPTRTGIGIALGTAVRSVASILGIALFGSVVAIAYRRQLGTPAFLPAPLHDPATESIGASIDAAASLPPSAADRLLDEAHGAFSVAFHVATAITLASLAITAVAAWKLLPGREPILRANLDAVEEAV